ncbi:YajG family lipoprotein [Thalassotalea atypica]|uniref:YajG family lipoprotein n=1 Tax=Thalassotalea atypica TaxID=2054316 RepID=UPI0025723FAF|nr:YajG family lipoprotein [Thalassotalea atypica]
MKSIAPLFLSAVLIACGSTPSSIIIAPQVYAPIQSLYHNQSVQLSITDLRRQHHVIQVLKKDQAAKLYSPANDLASILNQSLTTEWKNQGLAVNDFANITMNVYIDAALVSVQQETVKYQANSEIRLRIEINKAEKTLTNHFKSKGSSNGPLFADVAVLERDFNQQLGKVIAEILSNNDIQHFINH